jgi:hypothetical protein
MLAVSRLPKRAVAVSILPLHGVGIIMLLAALVLESQLLLREVLASLFKPLLHVFFVLFLILQQILELGQDVLALVVRNRRLCLDQRFRLLLELFVNVKRLRNRMLW